MALHVSSIDQLKTLAKIKFKKENFAKLSEAQEALARELKYRDWFHAIRELTGPQDNTRFRWLMENRAWCYAYCGEYDERDDKRLYIPSIVFEDESGHFPMRGNDDQLPYYWGTSAREIKATCLQMNAERHITKEDASRITTSSIRAQNIEKGKREEKLREEMVTWARAIADLVPKEFVAGYKPARIGTREENEALDHGECETVQWDGGPRNWGIAVANTIAEERDQDPANNVFNVPKWIDVTTDDGSQLILTLNPE